MSEALSVLIAAFKGFIWTEYFPGYSSHQSSLSFRQSVFIFLYSEMIWVGLPSSVYSGALTTLILANASHLTFLPSCYVRNDVAVQEAPDSVTVSGPLSRLREAMAEIFAEPCTALLSRPWLYLWSSAHRLWMESRPMGHFIQLTQRK